MRQSKGLGPNMGAQHVRPGRKAKELRRKRAAERAAGESSGGREGVAMGYGQFSACPGVDAPTVDGATCFVCAALKLPQGRVEG